MSDVGRVLSPLKTSPLSGSQCSSHKGRDVPPGLLGGISAFESLGLRFEPAVPHPAVHPASGQRSPEGPEVHLLAWHRALPSESPGDGISAVHPSGKSMQGIQGGSTVQGQVDRN